jgi:hypothetical protein
VQIEPRLSPESPENGNICRERVDFRQILAQAVLCQRLFNSVQCEKYLILRDFCGKITNYLKLNDWLAGVAVLIAPVSGQIPC